MASAFDVHAASLADYLAWLSSQPGAAVDIVIVPVFTWSSEDYACNYRFVKSKILGAGGYTVMDMLVLEVLETMDPGPDVEDLITFGGRDFRVMQVELAAGKNPKLTCYDPSKGA
jgi:hypothetical protein